jgi:long-chain acyl-CoA synthetase
MNGPFNRMMQWWKESDGDELLTPQEPPSTSSETPPAWLKTTTDAGIPTTLQYPATTLAKLLDQSADRFGDVTAVIYSDTRISYRELLIRVNRMAGALAQLGVRKNERVVLTLPNCPEFVICFFAIQKLGAIVVNAGPLIGIDDLHTVIAATTPRVVIGLDLQETHLKRAGAQSTVEHWVWVSLQGYQNVLKRLGYQFKLWQGRDFFTSRAAETTLSKLIEDAPAKPPTIEPDLDATAVLQPTSGTTGALKLAQLSHRNLISNAMQITVWMNALFGQERVLAVLPMFHVYGLATGLISPILGAGTIILETRFDVAECLELLEQHRPTIFPVVPAICDALSTEIERLDKPPKFDSLRLCFSGAAPLSRETAERFTHHTGADVIEGFGLTEASPVTHANLPGRPMYGSVGLPMPDTQCRVADLDDVAKDAAAGEPGELLVAGPQIFSGYFGNPDETQRSLYIDNTGQTWLRTGDIVRLDDNGFFFIVDRRKDMIIRSGLKVYPAKLERVLRGLESIEDVAIIGRPDPVHTETVIACVVLKDRATDTATAIDEIKSFCRQHMAPYEVPSKIEFMDSIPRSALGKVLKKELRTAHAEKAPQDKTSPEPKPRPIPAKEVL